MVQLGSSVLVFGKEKQHFQFEMNFLSHKTMRNEFLNHKTMIASPTTNS